MWKTTQIADQQVQLMNLDHKSVELRVIEEMDRGIDVYYDRRWTTTGLFADWLSNNPDLYTDKNVLVLGAGVGAETVILGKRAKHLWINDLAPTALELCAEQLEKNDINNYTPLLGMYEDIELPKVDLVVASFLVYNKQTLSSIKSYMQNQDTQFLLMNEHLKEFTQFLNSEPHKVMLDLVEEQGAVCVLL